MSHRALVVPAGAVSEDVAAWRSGLLHVLAGGERLVTLFGRPDADGAVLTAVTERADRALAVSRVRLSLEPGIHTLVDAHSPAHVFEREIHEQLHLRVRGHPWLKPVRFERGGDVDTYPFLAMAGRQVHEVQVGPIHAGVIEPGAFRFLCHGEEVHHLEIHLGYQHRGVEALLLRTPPFAAGPLVEVVAGDTSVGHAWAWAAAMEALGGGPLDAEIGRAREIVLELERVAMHFVGLAGLAQDIGALQAASTWQRLRTTVINATMKLCGSRFGRAAVRPGGSGVAATAELRGRLHGELDAVARDHARVAAFFLEDRVTRHRFVGCGRVGREDALALGMVGLAARASGVPVDLRAGLDRTPVVRTSGDVMARAEVRALEVPESLSRAQALLAAGDLAKRRVAPWPLAPDSVAIGVVEGWRGEVVHALETGPDGALRHAKVQDPSLRNWFGLALALRGEDISDFPINNKSFDLSYCGNDL